TTLQRCSALWRSAPMGPADQPDYINAVAGVLTRLDALTLLTQLQGIEQRQGRRRDGERWGARTLDLDLLVFGSERCESDVLQLPHPGIGERAFVLAPLAQVAPCLRVPGAGRVSVLAEAIDTSAIALVDER
ncbi:MAG: 2-amino-4-hydroxy-6-hydroxymethyldihydropteridine diphosphokinase, partial [Pseudomonadota bacterium]